MKLTFQERSASEFVSRIIPPQAEGNMSVVMKLTFQERSEQLIYPDTLRDRDK